jgi:hypothetical protein
MKKNEIKRTKTIEEVVRVEYIAEDGTVFYDEAEALKYEESALFAVSKKLKRLSDVSTTPYDLLEEGSDEAGLEIFDVQTEEDLENLRRYLYLTLTKNGASENSIKDCFTSDGVHRKDFVFDNVTIGHEVLIFWGYDEDWFWVYKDGSLDGYFSWLRDKYNKLITPKENN